MAGAADYQFQLAGKPTRAGDTTTIQVRLLHLPDKKPVEGAILIQPKLSMGEGHASMTAPVSVAPPPGPGLYALGAQPDMGGEWALNLAAKVPGETATIRGTIVLQLAE
jgi:hypothetical protein